MRKLITKGEIAQLLEMSRSQIRFYEQKGLLKPMIDSNGYALYDFDELDQLEMIKLLSELNTPIKAIKKIIDNEESYDYPRLLKKSQQALDEEIKALKLKKKIVEQKLKAFAEDEVNTFSIKHYDDRPIIMLIDDKIETLKSIYDLLKINNMRYLNYENELYSITKNNIETFGFANHNPSDIKTNFDIELLKSGNYFTYIISYNYDDDFGNYEKIFSEEAQKRNLNLEEPLIFIEHFGRKFYYKDRNIGTLQRKIGK